MEQNLKVALDVIEYIQKTYPRVAGQPVFAWGTMVYGCMGASPSPQSKGCGFEHRVYLSPGCEGPPGHKVPVPMFCGTCPDCGGMLGHVRWSEDETFLDEMSNQVTFRAVPDGAAYFRLPTVQEARKNSAKNYWGAEYEDPSGKTRRPTSRADRRGTSRSRSRRPRRR